MSHTIRRSYYILHQGLIIIKLSRGEICVANLKAPLRMVFVWVVNKSEKIVLKAKGWKQPNLQALKYGWTQKNKGH